MTSLKKKTGYYLLIIKVVTLRIYVRVYIIITIITYLRLFLLMII